MSCIVGGFSTTIEGIPRESIEEKLHRHSDDLRHNKKDAMVQILRGLESLADLVNSTRFPIF